MSKYLTDFSKQTLSDLLSEKGFPSFHAAQLFDWVYKKNVVDYKEMTNLGKALQDFLIEKHPVTSLQFVKMEESSDGETFKFLWKLHTGEFLESVLICSGSRRTVCVSSQVGCPAKCSFCASGQMGFFRNLMAHEIVEQVLLINNWLAKKGERVSHLVYMGMGEPLKNYESVVQSIRVFTDPNLWNISDRRITVSTVGIVEGIKRLAHEGFKVNLVLSLHAPNQHVRLKIIPYARKYPLDEIIKAMDEYSTKTKRDITYEYTLLAGINDHADHAFELAHLLKGRQCTVNLIPYNPIPGRNLKRPDKTQIKAFRSVLFGCKVINTCRYTKGVDIAAACGQLAMQRQPQKLAIAV